MGENVIEHCKRKGGTLSCTFERGDKKALIEFGVDANNHVVLVNTSGDAQLIEEQAERKRSQIEVKGIEKASGEF